MKKPVISMESLEPFFEKVGKLSKAHRIAIYSATFVILIGVFAYFSYLPKFQKISELKSELEQLEQQLVATKAKAGQLSQYRKEHADRQSEFIVVKKSLPEEKDIPQLLESISLSGQEAGLEFLLFEPKPEIKKEFYSAIPVDIRVKGSYRNVEDFLDRVSMLPRIVNMTTIKMKPEKEGILDMQCTAVTYRFLETQEKTKEKKK